MRAAGERGLANRVEPKGGLTSRMWSNHRRSVAFSSGSLKMMNGPASRQGEHYVTWLA